MNHHVLILRLKVVILLLFHANVDICSIIFISENTVCADNYIEDITRWCKDMSGKTIFYERAQ